MNADCGILEGAPRWEPYDALVLAFTPGIPIEWIFAALRLGKWRRRKLREMIEAADRARLERLGRANAESVVEGDGWKMIRAVASRYAGAVPLYSQLELANDRRTDGVLGQLLGVNRQKVRRWRKRCVFDPLTGCRLVPHRGRSAL